MPASLTFSGLSSGAEPGRWQRSLDLMSDSAVLEGPEVLESGHWRFTVLGQPGTRDPGTHYLVLLHARCGRPASWCSCPDQARLSSQADDDPDQWAARMCKHALAAALVAVSAGPATLPDAGPVADDGADGVWPGPQRALTVLAAYRVTGPACGDVIARMAASDRAGRDSLVRACAQAVGAIS